MGIRARTAFQVITTTKNKMLGKVAMVLTLLAALLPMERVEGGTVRSSYFINTPHNQTVTQQAPQRPAEEKGGGGEGEAEGGRKCQVATAREPGSLQVAPQRQGGPGRDWQLPRHRGLHQGLPQLGGEVHPGEVWWGGEAAQDRQTH